VTFKFGGENIYVLYNHIDRGHLEKKIMKIYFIYITLFFVFFVIVWTSSYVNNLYIVK